MSIKHILRYSKIILKKIKKCEDEYYSKILKIRLKIKTLKEDEQLHLDPEIYNFLKLKEKILIKGYEDMLAKKRFVEDVLIAFSYLPSSIRMILFYSYECGRTQDWVAPRLRISKSTLGRRKKYGLDKIYMYISQRHRYFS